VDDWHTPYGEMDVPREPHRGHGAFASEFASFAAGQGFDIAQAQGLQLDHGMAIPLMFIDPDRQLPIVPLYLNIMMQPMLSFARSLGPPLP
jgi:aromatic ring-opening dioxygenase catalytic subunit (LigB family)